MRDINNEDKRIFMQRLVDEDLTEYRNRNKFSKKGKFAADTSSTESLFVGAEHDKIVHKLRGCLKSNDATPQDLLHQLQTDLDEKEKLRRIQA